MADARSVVGDILAEGDEADQDAELARMIEAAEAADAAEVAQASAESGTAVAEPAGSGTAVDSGDGAAARAGSAAPRASVPAAPGVGTLPGLAPRRPEHLSYTAPSEQGDAISVVEDVPTDFTGVGRNELCPCGSGKKFKRCHGAPRPRV